MRKEKEEAKKILKEYLVIKGIPKKWEVTPEQMLGIFLDINEIIKELKEKTDSSHGFTSTN